MLALWSVAAGLGLRRGDAGHAASPRACSASWHRPAAMLAFILFTSNPFVRLLPAAAEGRSLNPLLQDPGLVLHPPLLYLGYVGTALPFAVTLAALAWGEPRAGAVAAPVHRRGAGRLSLGIALGSWWAYYELGWAAGGSGIRSRTPR